jgi:hypothetical protein
MKNKILSLIGYALISLLAIVGIIANSLVLSGSEIIDLGDRPQWQTILLLVIFALGAAIGIYKLIVLVWRLIRDLNINKENK